MPTSFLSLPRELRDEIYKLVLLSPDGFVQMQLVIYGKKMDSQQSRRIKSPQKPATFKRSAHKNLDKQSHFRLLHNPTQSHLADLATQARDGTLGVLDTLLATSKSTTVSRNAQPLLA